MKRTELLKDLEIYEPYPLPVSDMCPKGGIGLDWSAPLLGWGQFHLWWDDENNLHADTECLDHGEDKQFTQAILNELCKRIIIDG